MNLYPPILLDQRASIAEGSVTGNFTIPFTMPLATVTSEIRHVQVLIRRQINLESWSSQSRTISTPDLETIYLPRTAISNIDTDGEGGGLYYLVVPGTTLRGPFPAGADGEGETFTIQIRFGASAITYTDVNQFANWRRDQVTASLFGEWSNTQRMFVYRDSANLFSVTVNPSPIGGFHWTYNPPSNDPIAQVRVKYSWSTPDDDAYGNMFRAYNVDFQSHDGMGASAAGDVDTGVILFSPITVVLNLTTINNTSLEKKFTITQAAFRAGGFHSVSTMAGRVFNPPTFGEELEDGMIPVTLAWTNSGTSNTNIHSLYRVNLRTLQTVKLQDIPPTGSSPSFEMTFKDYSVEMGEEYVYFCIGFNTLGVYQYALVWDVPGLPDPPLDPDHWKPHLYPGYSRQMDFQGNSFLTTKFAQLKLQGNTQIGSFQRNTSDQFTQTIGGEYPFYSRSAQFNYRTFSLQTLISLNFDITNTFLRFKSQIATSQMGIHLNTARQQYSDTLKLIPITDPERSKKIEAAQQKYYWDINQIYRGFNPFVNPPVPFLAPDQMPLWMTGQLWQVQNQDSEYLVLRDTELFSDFQFSGSMKRVLDPENTGHQLQRTDQYNEGLVRGPSSRYDARKMRDASHVRNGDYNRASELIYAERRFRDAVMKWMSDGQPKLFRSETEGNMIVMLSGVTFAPFNKSRLLYSLSATVTEIAEYNLDNLILYGLVPVEFESFYLPNIEFGFIPGSTDTSISGV